MACSGQSGKVMGIPEQQEQEFCCCFSISGWIPVWCKTPPISGDQKYKRNPFMMALFTRVRGVPETAKLSDRGLWHISLNSGKVSVVTDEDSSSNDHCSQQSPPAGDSCSDEQNGEACVIGQDLETCA